MDPKRIRSWLLSNPRPSQIKVLSATDGESRIVDITPGVSWASLGETVHALQPELMEALDAEGKVLRSIRPDDDGDAKPPVDEESTAIQNVRASMVSDPESQRLVLFADLLARAYRHSTDVAFERMVSMFEAVNRRSETLESSLDSMVKLLKRAVSDSVDARIAAAEAGANAGQDDG